MAEFLPRRPLRPTCAWGADGDVRVRARGRAGRHVMAGLEIDPGRATTAAHHLIIAMGRDLRDPEHRHLRTRRPARCDPRRCREAPGAGHGDPGRRRDGRHRQGPEPAVHRLADRCDRRRSPRSRTYPRRRSRGWFAAAEWPGLVGVERVLRRGHLADHPAGRLDAEAGALRRHGDRAWNGDAAAAARAKATAAADRAHPSSAGRAERRCPQPVTTVRAADAAGQTRSRRPRDPAAPGPAS